MSVRLKVSFVVLSFIRYLITHKEVKMSEVKTVSAKNVIDEIQKIEKQVYINEGHITINISYEYALRPRVKPCIRGR